MTQTRPVIGGLLLCLASCVITCDAPTPNLTYRSPPEATIRIGGIHSHAGIDGSFEFSDGQTTAVVESLVLVISAVEVHACLPEEHPDAERDPPAERINFNLYDLLGSTAQAHTPGSSTRLGTPVARDLTGKPGRARIVGELAPPLGLYCRVYPIIAPADDDLANPTTISISDLQGHSLMIRGRWREGKRADWKDFQLTSDIRHVVELPALNPNTGDAPIRLRQRSDVTMTLVEPRLSRDTFEGLASSLPNASGNIADTILQRIVDSMTIHEF